MRYLSALFLISACLACFTSFAMAQYSGSYDVGGGNMDFGSPVHAASFISIYGVTGPVICNIYSGTMWHGTLNFPHNIPGISHENTITFRNAPGQSPVLTQPSYNQHIIYMNSADYITIEGLEFTNCENSAIYFHGSETDSCREIRIIGNYVHDVGTDPNGNYFGIAGDFSADCEIRRNEVSGVSRGIALYSSARSVIANNMVYDCAANIYYYRDCIELFYGNNNLICHNSCRSEYSDILLCAHTSNLTIYNNVLFQEYSHPGIFAAILLSYNSSATCDYNIIYAPTSSIGYNGNYGFIQTFSGWQDTMGVDAHSINANPNFVSGTNLHINDPSPAGVAGIAVPEVADDYDGDIRKTPHPDIGADEYLLPLAGSYDINGGANDFATLQEAANYASLVGLVDHVYFNVYSGTYNGQINLPSIQGTSESATLTIRPTLGHTVVITNTTGTSQTDGNGFYLTGADYITIQGLEITNTAANGIFNSYNGSDFSSHNRFVGNYIHNVGTNGDYSGISLSNSPDCEISKNEIDADYNGIKLSASTRNLIANNMIYFAELSGIYEDGGSNNSYYYNSVFQEMTPTTSYALYLYHGNDIDLKNNILYHAGAGIHYAISIIGNLVTYPVTSDYNDLYAPSAYVGYYSTNQTTLANWQTATGLDANSLSADPDFVSIIAPDLHCNPTSPLESAGTPIPEITDDFDGEIRDFSTPDIGADEFNNPLAGIYDVGGGANDFPSPQVAAQMLEQFGISGPVVFNIFTGTYDGQVSISNTISGLGESNTLTFQSVPGESPIITCIGTPSGRGFWIYKADYVTIQGLEISDCNADGICFLGTTSDSATHNRAMGNYIHDIGSGFSAIFVQRAADCEVIGNEITNAPTGIYCAMGRGNLIANNMVYETTTAGLWSYYGLDDSFYYNSVYTDTLKALLVRQSTNPIIENNILFQNGAGNAYAFYVQSSVANPTSNYNDLYAPNAYVGYYSSSQTTLFDWQTASGLDPNSISINPNFVSAAAPFDLHVNEPSPVDGACAAAAAKAG